MSQEQSSKPKLPQTTQQRETESFLQLIPLAKTFLENQNRELTIREMVGLKKLEMDQARDKIDAKLNDKSMDIDRHKFNLQFGLVVFIVFMIFALSVGLIFLRDDTKTGMLILSHVGAVVAGLMTGLGWQKRQSAESVSRDEQDQG